MPTERAAPAPAQASDTRGLRGQPAGLTTLFLTELWERFSYYGMRTILVLFKVAPDASALTAHGKISPFWLPGVYLFDVAGELCLSPVGLSTVTKLAPVRFIGLMMGLWFFATSLGNKLAGFLSGYFVADNPGALVRLYGGIAAALILSGILLHALTPAVRRWSGEGQSLGGQ